MLTISVIVLALGILLVAFFLETGWGKDWAILPIILSFMIMVAGATLSVLAIGIKFVEWLIATWKG